MSAKRTGMICVLLIVVLIWPHSMASAGQRINNRDSLTIEIATFLEETVLPFKEVYTLAAKSECEVYLGEEFPVYRSTDDAGIERVTSNARPIVQDNKVVGIIEYSYSASGYSFAYWEKPAVGMEMIQYPVLVNIRGKLKIVDAREFGIETDIVVDNPTDSLTKLCLNLPNDPAGKEKGEKSVPDHYSLAVPTVYQTTPYNCWAACVASVTNYFKGTTYSDSQIATDEGLFYGAGMYSTKSALEHKSVSVSSVYSSLSSSQVMSWTYAGAPIVAEFDYGSSNTHMMVIRGYSSGASYFTVLLMDPENGSASASVSSGSNLVLSYGGDTLYLYSCVKATS